jgi:hypothetical protein
MLVPGLDRLDGTALEGMPDAIWAIHTDELKGLYSGSGSGDFKAFCAP